MSHTYITGAELHDMVCVAASFLEQNKKAIDALNVFPVPDGDTGTNMSLTLQTAAREVREKPTDTVAEVANAMAMGSLKGARGNSGVILSQIFRGFAAGLAAEDEMNAEALATALEFGVESAYKAVMKPKEGTILTVARSLADEARRLSDKGKDAYETLSGIIVEGEKTLAETPELLPVLKEAGVVDSGGMGLIVIMKGFKMSLDGHEVTDADIMDLGAARTVSDVPASNEDIEFGYCTEFMIKSDQSPIGDGDMNDLRDTLSAIGDCVLVVGDSSLVKVHVHTNAPGEAMQHGLALGQLSGIKVDNMREQHHNIMEEADGLEGIHDAAREMEEEKKDFAFVAVAMGDGISSILGELGVDEVVQGGQSMNPSTEDILSAIQSAPSDQVFVFPNNKNIVLAAEQAAQIVDGKQVAIIHSTSIPQGISGIIAFNPDVSFEENAQAMEEAILEVESGVVTYAVRDTKFNGSDIKEGDILGMHNDELACSGKTVDTVSEELIQIIMKEEEKETISLFYGKDVLEEDAQKLSSTLQDEYPDCDVQLYRGGQPLYYYIISLE